MGTTSACAENTLIEAQAHIAEGNYLRVRGEYDPILGCLNSKSELPPRARRIHEIYRLIGEEAGTTSACAENTQPDYGTCPPRWNYLRVRGEYMNNHPSTTTIGELPPRARRILFHIEAGHVPQGTTSACAENTSRAQ